MVAGGFCALLAYLTHNLVNCDVMVTLVYFSIWVGAGWALGSETCVPGVRGMSDRFRWPVLLGTLLWTLAGAWAGVSMTAADLEAKKGFQEARPSGGFDLCVEHLEAAVRLAPWKGYYHAVFALAMDRMTAGGLVPQMENALQLGVLHAEEAMGYPCTNPENPTVTLATLYGKMGRLDEAVSATGRAHAMAPQFWAIHRLMALLLLEQGMPEEGLTWTMSGLTIYPRKRQMKETAEKLWGAVVPAQAKATMQEANDDLAQKRLPEAIEAFQRAIEQSGGRYPKAWHNLGCAYRADGNLREAERCFREALKWMQGLSPEPQLELGALLARTDRTWEGIEHLEEARKLSPESALPSRFLAIAYRQMGDRRRSLRCLKEYLALEPDPAQRASIEDLLGR